MTRTHQVSHADFLHFIDMTENTRQKYEAHLRKLKGDEYNRSGEIIGMSFDHPARERGQQLIDDSHDMEDYIVSVGVKTNDGRKIMTEIPTPKTWDLTGDLVVLLEYLDLEPEDLHTLGTDDRTLPVTFDVEEMTYKVDFSHMRDSIIDGNDE